jgi:Protein of unknown function (DUF998)
MTRTILALGSVVMVVVLHFTRPDVSPLMRGISRYASGRTLVPMTAAFLMLAGAFGVAAWTTRSWLLGIAAIAQAAVAAFPDSGVPPDRSLPHTVFGAVFFVTAVAGLYTSHRWPSPFAWLPVLALLLFFASVAGVPLLARIPGLLQRVCFVAIAASLIAIRAAR